MTSARIWSLLGSALSFSRVASSRLGKVSAAISGLSRSGSGNTASKAITTAPSRVRSLMISASLERGRIGEAQHGEADQERKAHQPRVAELPREPPSQYPQALHAIQISRPGGLITFSLLGWRRALAMENEVAGV